MREMSTRLPWLILFLAALWIVVFWMWPGPGTGEEGVEIRFDRESLSDPVERGETSEDSVGDVGVVIEELVEPAPVEEDVSDLLEDAGPEEVVIDEGGGEIENWIVPPTARVYVSQQGDTFQKISQRFYGTMNHWRAIARMNDVDPNRLGPGTRLLIPLDPGNVQGVPADEVEERPEEPAYAEYIVSSGDTLSEISQALYGRAALWRRIAEANPGIDPDRLRPGTVLKIPPPPASDER